MGYIVPTSIAELLEWPAQLRSPVSCMYQSQTGKRHVRKGISRSLSDFFPSEPAHLLNNSSSPSPSPATTLQLTHFLQKMYSKRLVVSVTAVAALSSSAILAHSCAVQAFTTSTLYGSPDNSPLSSQFAYNCGGRNYIAGGTGTYDDPVTFALAPGEFNECEAVYLPYLEKYVRMEDTCDHCSPYPSFPWTEMRE